MADQHRPARSRFTVLRWTGGALVAVVGTALGFGMGYNQSLGGWGSLGVFLLGLALAALVVATLVVAMIAALLMKGRGRLVVASLAAGGLLLGGAAVGYVSVPLFDLGYRAPVVLEATGTMVLQLDGAVGFEPAPAPVSTCGSLENSELLLGMEALDLGRLMEARLRGTVVRNDPHGDLVEVFLSIDGADLEDGFPPTWSGGGIMSELDPDGRGGLVTFSRLSRETISAVGKGVDGKGLKVAEEWPDTLAGTLRWQCDAWRRGSAVQ